ncbi:unnamed protein product [Caenorhabditis brenneri]
MSFAVGTPVIAILEDKSFPATIHQVQEVNGKIGYWVNFVGFSHQFNQWYSTDEKKIALYPSTPENEAKFFCPERRGVMPSTTKRVPIEVPKPFYTKNRTRMSRDKNVKPSAKKTNDRMPELDFKELTSDDSDAEPSVKKATMTDVDTKTSKQEEPIFYVEDISAHRRRSNKLQFLVKWQGYSPLENTWENLDNLETAKQFIYRHLEECMLPELIEEVKQYYGDE